MCVNYTTRSYPGNWTYRPSQLVPHQGHLQTAHPRSKWHPPYSCFEGDPTDKGTVSPPVARWERTQKHPLHGRESFSPSRSSITTRTTIFMLKSPWMCIPRLQGCPHPSYVMVCWEISHQWLTHLHFCKKGSKLVSKRIKWTSYKELCNSIW